MAPLHDESLDDPEGIGPVVELVVHQLQKGLGGRPLAVDVLVENRNVEFSSGGSFRVFGMRCRDLARDYRDGRIVFGDSRNCIAGGIVAISIGYHGYGRCE